MANIGKYIMILFCTGICFGILFFIVAIISSVFSYYDMPVYSPY